MAMGPIQTHLRAFFVCKKWQCKNCTATTTIQYENCKTTHINPPCRRKTTGKKRGIDVLFSATPFSKNPPLLLPSAGPLLPPWGGGRRREKKKKREDFFRENLGISLSLPFFSFFGVAVSDPPVSANTETVEKRPKTPQKRRFSYVFCTSSPCPCSFCTSVPFALRFLHNHTKKKWFTSVPRRTPKNVNTKFKTIPKGGIGETQFPLVSDLTKKISENYGVDIFDSI